ncbi:MAG: hypothetical protein IJH63_11415 [Methanobrevibacter sp.]|nr:hypothetical protein [Methanobrevibacter sp.]
MVNCKYCGESTSNKNAICNNCKNKLNAKKYLKAVLVNFKPDEVFSKRNLGLYLDKSFNVDIVLLTLNDYGMVVRRGSHGYKLATKKAIDEFLSQEDLTQIKSKKTKKSSRRKSKKKSKLKSSNIKKDSFNNEPKVIKKCKICGTDLPPNSKNDICRKCSKKAHALNVLEEIIPITGVGIPFKKEDLDNLYNNNPIKSNDTIWTLQDFNLVKSIDTNTFELVSEGKLDQFFKENNSSNTVSDLLSKTSSKTLQKTCLKCNKALSISEFRKISEDEYSDYCKSCDKKIRTASYAIEFIDCVGFKEFKISDVNIENAQGKIFNLQDNDLISFNGNSYQLVDEEIVYSYINHNTDDNAQFENILEAFKEDVTMIQAAKSVGVSNVEVTKYYIEGKNGNPKYVHFFNEINTIKFNKLEKMPCPKCKSKSGYYKNGKCKKCGYVNISLLSLDKKMDFVLSHIRENNSVKSAKELDIPYDNVKNWNKLGKAGLSPYDKFYKGIINIKEESKENAIKRNKIDPIEERLNGYLRKIQSTELTLDKNIIKLKSIDLDNKKIKSEYDEIYSEINIMKNDLIFQKNEIKSIKDSLMDYSIDELDNIKSFDIKGTRSISLKVNKLLKKNDEYTIKQVNKYISKLENQIMLIKVNIKVSDSNLLKLEKTSFVDSLKNESIELIDSITEYKSYLNKKNKLIDEKISDLKSKNISFDLDEIKINFNDYSFMVDVLISKNKNLISKQMEMIITNLDENKELNQIYVDLGISSDDAKSWYDLGKFGNKDYIKFYDKINEYNDKKEKLISEKSKNNLIEELEKELENTNELITDLHINSYNLSKIFVMESLESDILSISDETEDLKLKLNNYKSAIEENLSNMKENHGSEITIDYIDFSAEIENLISRSKKIISTNEKLISEKLNKNTDTKNKNEDVSQVKHLSNRSNSYTRGQKYPKKVSKRRYKAKLIKEYENKKIVISDELEKLNKDITKLNDFDLDKSLNYSKSKLIRELYTYKTNLINYSKSIDIYLLNIKNNDDYSNFYIEEFEFMDYSNKINELISQSKESNSNSIKHKNLNDLNKISSFDKKIEETNNKNNSSGVLNKLINKFKENSSEESSMKLNEKSSSNESNVDLNKESPTENKLQNSNNESKNESQEELVLKYYKETKDLVKASNLANVPLFLVKFWYNEGKKGKQQYIDFYNQMKKIEKL